MKYFDREEIKFIKSEISNLGKCKDKTDYVFDRFMIPYSVNFSNSFEKRIINTESIDFNKVSEIRIKTHSPFAL